MNLPSATGLLSAALLAGLLAPAAPAQQPSERQTAAPQAPAEPPPSAEQIRQAVKQLSSPSFSLRQEASELLWRAGRAAEPALRQALESGDPEVVFRAGSILEQFRFGIYPGTPLQVIRLIETYRDGNLALKQQAIKSLRQRGATSTVLALLRAESNAAIRQQLAGDVKSMVPDLLADGKYDDAENALELTAGSSDDGKRNLGVFLLLTGRLDARIAALRRDVTTHDDADRRRLLIFLLRTGGKLDDALRAAETPDDRFDSVREELLFQKRDWPALGKRYSEALKTNPALEANIELLGYAAAVHRLAGDRAALERDVAAIKKLNADSEQAFYCAEALLVNGRFDEGIEMLRDGHQEAAFRLLSAQMRYREAFALVGLGEKAENADKWFADLARDLKSEDPSLRGRLGLGLAAARTLLRLGRRETAGQGLATIGKALAGDEDGRRLEQLCKMEHKLRFRQQALDHAAIALAKNPSLGALDEVFPDQDDEAKVWWKFFRGEHAEESYGDTLDRVAGILAPPSDVDGSTEGDAPTGDDAKPAASGDDADWRASVARAAKTSASLEETQRGVWLEALAETCVLHGDRKQAKELLTEAAAFSPAAAFRLGDLVADDEDWPAAAAAYEKAANEKAAADDAEPGEPNPFTEPASTGRRSLAYFLRGRALQKSGNETEGRRLMELGRLLPLADGAARRTLADGLKQRGLIDEAVAEWKLTLHSSGFRDWYTSNAALNLGNALSGKDQLAAANNWETLSLSVLRTSSAFIEIEGYLQLPHLVHKARAGGLLAEGKKSEAVENLWISQAAYPGDVDLAEDLIPQLEAAGLQATADELFAKVYKPNEQLCRDFPDNASAHNNLAWLAARNGRRLDEALAHARRAVELEPENAAYLDTLAEALFRTGKRQEAIELEQRCLAKDADNEHFLTQLARFKKAS